MGTTREIMSETANQRVCKRKSAQKSRILPAEIGRIARNRPQKTAKMARPPLIVELPGVLLLRRLYRVAGEVVGQGVYIEKYIQKSQTPRQRVQ